MPLLLLLSVQPYEMQTSFLIELLILLMCIQKPLASES